MNRTPSMPLRRALPAAGLILAAAALANPAAAQRRGDYPEQGGKEIYESICQGCHMPDGKGAQGAGMYPSLAGNPKLAAKLYPALIVVRGQKAMLDFGGSFSDAQVANVVNYVRTHFGNSFADTVAPDDIKAVRPAVRATGTVRPPG